MSRLRPAIDPRTPCFNRIEAAGAFAHRLMAREDNVSGRQGIAGCKIVVVTWALLGLVGCGSGVKTYPVQGQVVLADGDISQLADSHLEFMLDSDPTVRASGKIGPDGRFT